ncbi:hypothetical protein QTP70_024374, partial [Hemibagrus guttatus]
EEPKEAEIQAGMFSVFGALLFPLLVGSTPTSWFLGPTDCSDVYNSGQTLSGVYTIYPSAETPVQVYCDMGCFGSKPEDGKWTLKCWTFPVGHFPGVSEENGRHCKFLQTVESIQERIWGQVLENTGWCIICSVCNILTGLENLYQLTRNRKYELRVDLQDFDGVSVYAHYSYFSVESEAEGYKLHVSGFTNGGAGDSLELSNGQKFSTFDKDQDSNEEGNCAKSYLGAFWYNKCHHANPNGIYLWGKDGTLFAIGNVWYHWKGFDYGVKSITMKIRPVS